MDDSITIEENPVPLERRISKVHVRLREVKPKAYKPVLVSIGPYHKADPDLQAMQQKKELYLTSLLERRNKSPEQGNKSPESCEIYLAKLAEFNSEARKCYVDLKDRNDEFAKMMLLDGCFIVEFFRKFNNVVEFDKDDPIPKLDWMVQQIVYDMILLENQLPYFFLSKFYNMTKYEGEKPLEEMAMSCFNFMLPRPRNAFGNIPTGEINHLLHLVHVLCHPLPKKPTTSTVRTTCFSFFSERIFAKNRGIKESSDDQTCCPLLPQNNDSGSDKSYEMTNQMGTVLELQEAGVKFKKVGKIYNGKLKEEEEEEEDYVSLFDIDFKYEAMEVPCFKCGVMKVPCFKCGVMKVPCFKVDDATETLLRNLIAYEQHIPNVHSKYFTDFAFLMNELVNSKKDAKVLRFEEIIMNFLGGDDELSKLFNSLTDYVCQSCKPYYLEVGQKVDKHCKTNCNILMAKLRRDYFKNPWAGVSTVAASFLLLLTAGQFVIALLTLLA